ncbi:NAD(P)-dependent oxidoreductase [Leucobacter allii]|uniref:NAD(P)-dependent oxidoreductase n=1 Tax=Leucobacter allii TaxID=2932247 RepID=A0ABY4FNV0_9MICO|nr:NAD(P)-dependent oxidoreductase [Leucobacter allii]UOQ57894.1 NAD(P)-dependent oxidoreductase [Leucobacter allii]
MSRILFIGLGNMGAPMARRLADAGHELAVQDLDPDRVAALASASPRIRAAAPEDRARAEVVVTMLPTSDSVEAALEASGLVGELARGTLVVDMSSAEPVRSRALADRLGAAGLRALDAPVSGGVRGAEAGTLAIMVGGEDADVDAVAPMLRELGGTIAHVGGHGAGHAAKALNNLVSAASVVATAEAIRAARSFGIASQRFVEVLNASSGRSVTSEQKAERFMLSGTFDSGFPVGLMNKDVAIAVGLADAQGDPVVLGAHVAKIWAATAERFADADHTRMYELLDRIAVGREEDPR